jgi:hypothetical protein
MESGTRTMEWLVALWCERRNRGTSTDNNKGFKQGF